MICEQGLWCMNPPRKPRFPLMRSRPDTPASGNPLLHIRSESIFDVQLGAGPVRGGFPQGLIEKQSYLHAGTTNDRLYQ